MIQVTNLKKTFIKYEKEPGLKGMLKGFVNAKKVSIDAVKDVNFSIQKGEIVGYIGSNGAGKSTTIKMLTGILTPSSGEIKVNGIIPHQNRTQNGYHIGVVFGQRTQLWWDLPLIESFTILKEIYEVDDSDFKKRMMFFDELFRINELIKSPVRTLSLGERMRADIVASLIHNPKVLYLDEPTIGLDVNAKLNMREAIKTINEQYQTTVILTTHDLDDIEELSDRIIILDKGTMLYDGLLEEIKERYGYMKTITFSVKDEEEDQARQLPWNQLLEMTPEHLTASLSEGQLTIMFNKKLFS